MYKSPTINRDVRLVFLSALWDFLQTIKSVIWTAQPLIWFCVFSGTLRVNRKTKSAFIFFIFGSILSEPRLSFFLCLLFSNRLIRYRFCHICWVFRSTGFILKFLCVFCFVSFFLFNLIYVLFIFELKEVKLSLEREKCWHTRAGWRVCHQILERKNRIMTPFICFSVFSPLKT